LGVGSRCRTRPCCDLSESCLFTCLLPLLLLPAVWPAWSASESLEFLLLLLPPLLLGALLLSS
jgi:hypothetical protein